MSIPESPPPIVYGELSILGYNGYIPNGERSGRRDKSKFLLCKRSQANGIKKSRHYFVKQPQATRAIQDNDLYSISYTFSRSQTIIVEYKQDETTDMFQVGRSSEDPIDFVVMDTLPSGCNTNNLTSQSSAQGSGHGQHGRHSHTNNKHYSPSPAVVPSASSSSNHLHNYPNHRLSHNENASSSSGHQVGAVDLLGMTRFHRHLAKVGEDMLQYGYSPNIHDSRNGRIQIHADHGQSQAVLLNYAAPNISNLPQISNNLYSPMFMNHHHQPLGHPSGSQPNQRQYMPESNHVPVNNINQREHSSSRHQQSSSSRHNNNGNNLICKRSHTTQSTISRFACRVLVDREPPYTARIYAAGFDSSKNIFLGEKATKWEQNNSIDGLTTNGVLLMHPKRGYFYERAEQPPRQDEEKHKLKDDVDDAMDMESDDIRNETKASRQNCSSNCGPKSDQDLDNSKLVSQNNDSGKRDSGSNDVFKNNSNNSDTNLITSFPNKNASLNNDSNNNAPTSTNNRVHGSDFEYGGVWREVSVDGGIYAIRESRSAIQKGKRIENETNILQDGTLIDLCGATLLWRSLDGFTSAPTKKSLEEKIDMLNATRPQCPVGLNTLVIPRRPILPNNSHRAHDHNHHHHHHHHHHRKDLYNDDRSSHQPYVYLKCGHVQGYHDWGTTDKSNQRTCPICLSVGTVAKLSMGLEPSFYVDSGLLTHVFNPCGHMATEKTVKYWSSVSIPHGTHFFHAICPFCATPLATSEPATTKLIFQEDLD